MEGELSWLAAEGGKRELGDEGKWGFRGVCGVNGVFVVLPVPRCLKLPREGREEGVGGRRGNLRGEGRTT